MNVIWQLANQIWPVVFVWPQEPRIFFLIFKELEVEKEAGGEGRGWGDYATETECGLQS